MQFIDKCTIVSYCDFVMAGVSIKHKVLTMAGHFEKFDDGCAGKQNKQRQIADELWILPFTLRTLVEK